MKSTRNYQHRCNKLNPFSHFIHITCNSWLQHALVRHTVVCVLGLLLPYATVYLIHSDTALSLSLSCFQNHLTTFLFRQY